MKRTEIAHLYADSSAYSGKIVTVCGWVRTLSLIHIFVNGGAEAPVFRQSGENMFQEFHSSS